jgi:DNA replication protein DnaC
MFTLKNRKKNKAIACIEGKHFPNKLVRLNGNFEKDCEMEDELRLPPSQIISDDEIRSNYKSTKKNLVSSDINQIYRNLEDMNESPDLPKHLITTYNKILPIYKHRVNRSVHLDGCNLLPVFNTDSDMNNRFIIYGQTGCGKSYMANNLADIYHSMYPKNKIILFSAVEEDKSINDRIVKRFVIDDSIVTDPIKMEELNNSLLIFDDIECIQDKKQRAAVFDLINRILTTGRHYGTDLIFCTHSITNGKETKYLLQELSDFIFYPSSNKYQNQRVLKEYMGASNADVKKIFSLPSRWVCVHRGLNPYAMYNNGLLGL